MSELLKEKIEQLIKESEKTRKKYGYGTVDKFELHRRVVKMFSGDDFEATIIEVSTPSPIGHPMGVYLKTKILLEIENKLYWVSQGHYPEYHRSFYGDERSQKFDFNEAVNIVGPLKKGYGPERPYRIKVQFNDGSERTLETGPSINPK